MLNLVKKRFKFFLLDNKFVFIFFIVLVFVIYRQLFSSYFEADEWPAFTQNLPLTRDPLGFLKILIKSGGDSATIVQSQHIVPLGKELFFLSTLFFGTNFVPYAFISIFLHALNSFLVFVLIKLLLPRKLIYAFLGAIFFILAPTPMHSVTWAAIYPTSVLPVALSLLSIIFFKLAFLKQDKKFIYFSAVFLFLALFAKETAFILFLLFPLMTIIEKRILPAGRPFFPLKFLGKVFLICLVGYLTFRFLIPGIYSFSSLKGQQIKVQDTGTIVSRDLSIHKNLPGEVFFRTVTFPIKMIGSVFAPRRTVSSITAFINPIVYPLPSIADRSISYSLGETVILYPISIGILGLCIALILKFLKHRRIQELQALAAGLAIIVFSALPLVAIVFSFPRWGYDSYFDSRYYYIPTIGAAILFPFLLFGIAEFLSKRLRLSLNLLVIVFFIAWAISNTYVFYLDFNQVINKYGADRREIINQFKESLPNLPQRTVFYTKTDGSSIFGPVLPFYTSVPQALTVVYYDKSPLPNSFFDKPLFGGQPQGYQYSEGRGFGYYTDKKDLAEALVSNSFSVNDVYGFYYYADKTKLENITSQLREEMRDYLNETDISQWKSFADPTLKIKFLYPKSSSIKEISDTTPNVIKFLLIIDPKFSATVSFINVSPSFDIHEVANFLNQKTVVIDKDVSFDKYRSNKVTLVQTDTPRYYMRMTNALLQVKTDSNNPENMLFIERILGSFENL